MRSSLDHPALHLRVLPGLFFVRQLPSKPGVPLEEEVLAYLRDGSRFISVTRTNEEISIVGEAGPIAATNVEANWKCIRIAGPMDFGLTGILCDFTTPLKKAAVPVFAVSTYNTDYVLVPKGNIDDAVHALREDGWIFQE